MRKLVLLLVAMLLAAPAMGAVSVTCSHEGSGVFAISYDASGEAELVRAFALDITVDAGTIDSISDYSTDGSGYGIYPGSITISGGSVSAYGDPIAPSADPGALGGLGTGGITVEMGSLYEAGVDTPPGTSGLLCKVATTGAGQLNITTNATRGAVVLEDASQATVADSSCVVAVDPVLGTKWDPLMCGGQSLGDATCDGGINLGDLFALKAAWGSNPASGNWNCGPDFDHSKAVNLGDLFKLKANWGTTGLTPAAGNTTPCPSVYP